VHGNVIRRRTRGWLLTTLLLSGCATLDAPVVLPPASDDAVIYVIGRGWHSDICLPVDEITGPLIVLEHSFPGVRFLTFGFGERQFLLSRHPSFIGMLSALLPSRSALLMTALGATPDAAFGATQVVTLHLTHAGLARIEAALWQQIEKSPAGEPLLLADGPYPGSVFYAAIGTYDAFFTCNTWTADMLRSGGLPVSGAGVLFESQVMTMARTIAARQASLLHG
jgi:uncharacterized protein (TIGR02117 family)